MVYYQYTNNLKGGNSMFELPKEWVDVGVRLMSDEECAKMYEIDESFCTTSEEDEE